MEDGGSYGGDLYINLGEVSEDILRDGKKFYESGMPVGGTGSFTETHWGRVPVQATQTYAFATTSGSRALQDVGLNGLNDEEERLFPAYADFLQQVNVEDSVRRVWTADPANDDYHYFRGSDLDARQASILERYKRMRTCSWVTTSSPTSARPACLCAMAAARRSSGTSSAYR